MTTKPAAEVPNLSPEELNSVDEIMVPIKGRSYLRQYLPNKYHKWGFKILHDFDAYKGCSNKVANLLCSIFPKKENHKVFAGNQSTTH